MKTARVFSLIGVGAVLVACGGAGGGKHSTTPASPRLVQACDAIGAKLHECQPKRDIAEFKKECEGRDIFRFFDAVKPADVSDKLFACVSTNACAKNVAEATRACESDAVKTVTLSPRAKTLCAKLEYDLSDCSATGGSAFATPCDVEMRLYADADLKLFEECQNRNCRSGTACINEAHATIWSRPH